MSRLPRCIVPGVVYHLISRFVDRAWFIKEQEERVRYVSLLGRALSMSDWRCMAYAVMSNHLHLAVVAGTQTLDSWIRRVHGPFAGWMNKKYDRIGVMFVRGPKDFATPPDRVAHLLAYIHNNPVRANVVPDAAQSAWTSHRAYLGIEPTPEWLHVEGGLKRSGFPDGNAFNEWVRSGPSSDELEGARFLETAVNEADWRRLPPRKRALHDPDEVVRTVADEIGLSTAALRSSRREAPHLLGRRVAARCADELGISGIAIANALCISQQGVSVILRRAIEGSEVRQVSERVLNRLRLGG
jgi:hypothetical protein